MVLLAEVRPLYVLTVATVAVGLIGANYHFLSDVIAGAFVGLSVGWIAVRLWEAGGAPSVLQGGLPVAVPRSAVSAPPQGLGETAGAREARAFSGPPRT